MCVCVCAHAPFTCSIYQGVDYTCTVVSESNSERTAWHSRPAQREHRQAHGTKHTDTRHGTDTKHGTNKGHGTKHEAWHIPYSDAYFMHTVSYHQWTSTLYAYSSSHMPKKPINLSTAATRAYLQDAAVLCQNDNRVGA